MDSEDNANRINELISELGSCREDERNVQNQILQTVVTAGTVLGILLGTSYLMPNQEDARYYRVIFWMSILVFSAAFSYILVLGIGSVLRYYYIQDLEDRLHTLIPAAADTPDGEHVFLHWSGFCAPIITRSWKHISSSHTALHFFSYTVAAMSAVGFSIVMVYFLFLKIGTVCWYDYAGLSAALFLMVTTFVLFLRTSAKAKQMVAFSRDTARGNLESRKEKREERAYSRSGEFRRIALYFLYPKYTDPQKPALVVLGFLGGLALRPELAGPALLPAGAARLLYVLFVFEFLSYQARYQINDIRGIAEDENRLFSKGRPNPGYIRISLGIAALRIAAAAVLALRWSGPGARALRWALLLLLLSTVLYEGARRGLEEARRRGEAENRLRLRAALVYVLVGPGYPLRFFLGMSVLIPQVWTALTVPRFLALTAVFWAYGSGSSLLSWANQVTEKMRAAKAAAGRFPCGHRKGHFLLLQRKLEKRWQAAEGRGSDHPFPLRERGERGDPWNLPCLVMTAGFTAVLLPDWTGPDRAGLLLLELASLALWAALPFACRRGIPALCAAGCAAAALKGVWIAAVLPVPWWPLFLCGMQAVAGATYFVLRFSIQLPKASFADLLYPALGLLIGKNASWLLLGDRR